MSHVGPYKLIRRIGIGGMAEIFLARREGPRGFAKIVALKRILPHLAELSDFVGMFLDEARLAALLNHPHIVQVHDFGEVDGAYFISMEYVAGENLHSIQRRVQQLGQPLSPVDAATVVAHTCEALHHAHELTDEQGRWLGIVHRDVSPSNVIVSYDGVVKLADFGIAKAMTRASHTATGVLKGKYAYMSPEQALGKPIDRRSDIFSLGIVAHELLVGRRLFAAEGDLAMLKAITESDLAAPSALRPGLPQDLDRIVMRALARDRENRYASAQQMQTDLEAFLASQDSASGAKTRLARCLVALFGEEEVNTRRRWALGDVDQGEPTDGAVEPEQKKDARGGDGTRAPTSAETPRGAARRVTGRRVRPWLIAVPAAVAFAIGLVVARSRESASRRAPAPPPPPAAAARGPTVTPIERLPEKVPTEAPAASAPTAAARRDEEAPAAPASAKAPARAPRPAFLTLEVSPPAEVLLDGKPAGSTPVVRRRMEPGRHTVALVRRSHGHELRFTVQLRPGQDLVEKRALAPGQLVVDAQPWADVYTGTRKLGTTPLSGISLPEGTYALRLTNSELGKERTVSVTIRPGEVTRLKERF